jgi:CRISPR-associated protein Cas2
VALTVVVAYDISEDRRRARVAATLQQWGDRVQRSVFVCLVEPERLAGLQETVGEIIDVDTDSVYVFRQCGPCWDTIGVVGQASVKDEPYYWSVM